MKGEDMEEMMMMMINRANSPNNQSNDTSTCSTSWKVYDNPFYYLHNLHQQQCQSSEHIHHQAINTVEPFWEFEVMDSELDIARAKILDLQAELEHELKARKKAESMNKKLAKELAEERRGREALERVCDKLAREVSMDKAEIDKMKKNIEEERKMLRMAEVLREERVQMKMAEAKCLFEEKVLELEETKRANLSDNNRKNNVEDSEKSSACNHNINLRSASASASAAVSSSSMAINQRRASPEAENPHIKRGIKGFVEFPKVVRAIESKSRDWGSKLECQKAQLRILLKHKSPIRSNNLIMS